MAIKVEQGSRWEAGMPLPGLQARCTASADLGRWLGAFWGRGGLRGALGTK